MTMAATGACPICRKPREERYRPFCSKRCADVDLGRWFNGAYAVPVEEEPDPGEIERETPREDDPRR